MLAERQSDNQMHQIYQSLNLLYHLLYCVGSSDDAQAHMYVLLQMHGTGTPLGDPIEIGAIVGVYSATNQAQRITLASSKSSVGHAEPAAGMEHTKTHCRRTRIIFILCETRFQKPSNSRCGRIGK